MQISRMESSHSTRLRIGTLTRVSKIPIRRLYQSIYRRLAMAISEARVALDRVHLETAPCWNKPFPVTHASRGPSIYSDTISLFYGAVERLGKIKTLGHHNKNISPCDTHNPTLTENNYTEKPARLHGLFSLTSSDYKHQYFLSLPPRNLRRIKSHVWASR